MGQTDKTDGIAARHGLRVVDFVHFFIFPGVILLSSLFPFYSLIRLPLFPRVEPLAVCVLGNRELSCAVSTYPQERAEDSEGGLRATGFRTYGRCFESGHVPVQGKANQ